MAVSKLLSKKTQKRAKEQFDEITNDRKQAGGYTVAGTVNRYHAPYRDDKSGRRRQASFLGGIPYIGRGIANLFHGDSVRRAEEEIRKDNAAARLVDEERQRLEFISPNHAARDSQKAYYDNKYKTERARQ